MTMYAKVIADSIANDIRLTTYELYYPLMIHAQLMTHRMFSRNAQSNRAMPVAKMLEQVKNNPAMPSQWGKNQPGMSASEAFTGTDLKDVREIWECASDDAYYWLDLLNSKNAHKQWANRLTMPFQYIKVIVTATEWDNFFNLRLHDADPTMMELARKMKEAMDNSFPRVTKPGQWHLPYINCPEDYYDTISDIDTMIKCSVARCARVSYNNHDNSYPDIEKDIALADRLLKDGHMSPFEHQATPMGEDPCYLTGDSIYPPENWDLGVTHLDRYKQAWSGNFRGWIQYRNLV